MLGSFPLTVPLALHSSISYLGFFVNEGSADVIREFAKAFAMEAAVLAGRWPQPVPHAGRGYRSDPSASGAWTRGGLQGRHTAVPRSATAGQLAGLCLGVHEPPPPQASSAPTSSFSVGHFGLAFPGGEQRARASRAWRHHRGSGQVARASAIPPSAGAAGSLRGRGFSRPLPAAWEPAPGGGTCGCGVTGTVGWCDPPSPTPTWTSPHGGSAVCETQVRAGLF